MDQIWLWIGFNAFVLLMLALDLGVFHRKAHVVSLKEAAAWSTLWVALALAFNYGIYHFLGSEAGLAFLTGGGFLADIHWRGPFAVYGLAFILLPAVFVFLQEPRRFSGKPADSVSPATARTAASTRSTSAALSCSVRMVTLSSPDAV